MNLFQVVEYLQETERFSLEDLLTLSFRVFGDERVSLTADPLSPNTPYTPLEKKGNPVGELVRDFVNAKLSNCAECGRCETRTNVVMPDGFYDADIFIVSDYPDIAEDRTGIPLAGPFEIKSSNCVSCKNLGECIDRKYDRVCEYTPGNSGYTIKNSEIHFPGRVLSDSLVLGGDEPAKFTSTRASWSSFFSKVAPDEDTRKRWDIRPKIYITSLVKCWGPNDPTPEEIVACGKWLDIERKLSSAPVTLVLGSTAYGWLPKSLLSWEEAINQVQEDPNWGKVIVYDHPRDIITHRGKDDRMYTHMLGELEKRLRYIGEETKKVVYHVPDEGDEY